ncbi:MAG: hypothetical protein H0W61_04155 [Bacteroidetes bacterium]|nr:hypothetical protein [Bacteroidota bacterium]
MVKRIFLIAFIFCLGSSFGQTKKVDPKTKGKGKGKTEATTTQTVVEEPELSPMEKLESELLPEWVLEPNSPKKVLLKDRKRKNDSLRLALRTKLKKEAMTFAVKTKYPKKPNEKIQLCINISAKDTNITYCVNDSICKDPEVAKVLYEKSVGDTTFMLVYVDAFTKSKSDPGLCNAGHETKLFFARWNTKDNKAIWKQKTISSCIKGVTNMTKEPVANWDKSSVLNLSYHKGSNFYDLKFDPEHPELGIQSPKDSEPK